MPAALRFAVRLTGDADAAEDLVQEALLRAVRRWSTFRGEAEFRTWLFQIIINAFRDRIRASHASLPATDEPIADLADPAGVNPFEATTQIELEELIGREVSRLPPRQREVLTLIVFEGFTVQAVSGIVGI